jgi:hypothetical protein
MADNPVQKLDKAIFDQIDELKGHENYSKVQEVLAQIDEEYKEPLKILSTLAFFLIPALIIVIFLGINKGLKSDIEERQEILTMAGEILGNRDMIKRARTSVLANFPISSFNAFNTRVGQVVNRAGVDLSKIQMSDFNSDEIAGGVTKASITIKVKDLSSGQISELFNGFLIKEKMKLLDVSLKRDSVKKLVSGTFSLVHFGKGNND